jgi:hypothetical protein
MRYFFLLFLSSSLFATISEPIHSSVSAYYETISYSNSKQKIDSKVYGVGADIHHKGTEYKISYEQGDADTKQPPLQSDLHFKKLYLRYASSLNKQWRFNLNYINILNDNIAITDGGASYGMGLSYLSNKYSTYNFTQYYTDFKDFKVYQSDLRFDSIKKYSALQVKYSIIAKYLRLQDKNPNAFTHYAQSHYTTLGLKAHAHYNKYHFGAGAYFGERSFAIMNDGFKIQHHAMEFDRTYALGIGKTFSKSVLRMQYIYQRAKELPIQNSDVIIKNFRFILNYKF